ncbi:MAG: serine/threonine-protein kinase, partial [Nannocystaceae bacterium]
HRLPWSRVRGIGVQLCQALAAAHEKGIIHRDLKPENCFRITRAGNSDFIKVLDFGIAKILSDAGEGGKGLTQTGSIFGTPEYMSPEQAAGEKVDHRADIYSLGVILYELLTGRAPFGAESYMGVLAKHMFEAPIAPRTQAPDAEIPVDVEAIILKAMQKDRDLRFQDMHEFAAAIESVGTGAPPVVVVDEQLPRPTVETVMSFAEGGAAELLHPPQAGVGPPTEEPDELGVVPGRRKHLFVIAGAALAATLLLSMWFFGSGDPPPKEPPPTVEKVVVAAPDLPVEKPSPPVIFSIDVTTNTDAEVLNADDREVLGRTNGTGLKLSQRDEPYRLVLVAEGHQELEVEVLADRDKKIEFKLARTRSHKRRTKKKSKKKSKRTKGSGLRLKDPYAK